jgi:hypothetical protein
MPVGWIAVNVTVIVCRDTHEDARTRPREVLEVSSSRPALGPEPNPKRQGTGNPLNRCPGSGAYWFLPRSQMRLLVRLAMTTASSTGSTGFATCV